MKICILGAGNVASHLARAFHCAGHEIAIWNRSEVSLTTLREELQCLCTIDMHGLPADADLYLISVKDDVVSSVAEALATVPAIKDAMVAHTAGSLPADLLKPWFKYYGVLYPMQTFSKHKSLDYSMIPFFVEGEADVLEVLRLIAQSVSDAVYELSSEQRKHLHLASVFACNFVNHCFAISEQVLKGIGLPFSIMLPLIEETVGKVKSITPREGQTGPAVREDYGILETQAALLEGMPDEQAIYNQISQNIIKYKEKEPE